MANFPTSLDSWVDKVDNVDTVYASDVNQANDAVVALETKVGINSSAVTTSHDYKLSGVTSTAKALSDANLDTNGTLAANSDTKIPSQKAVKTYADTKSDASKTETLTNKTLTSPKINEDVALTATATLLNTIGARLLTDSSAIVIRYGSVVVTPNASGEGTVTFSSPFPTAYYAICFTNGDYTNNNLQIISQKNFNNSASTFDYHAFISSTGAAITTAIRFSYIAIGH